jgi:shikimate kinase
MVAHEVGTPVAQYLRDEGEAAFRTRELEALRIALDRSSDVVIATGGGIVCTSEARAALRDELTLWLDCDDDTILARVGEVDRPLLNGNPATLARLREERGEWYRSVSQSRVDTSGPLDEVVTEVARQVERLTP